MQSPVYSASRESQVGALPSSAPSATAANALEWIWIGYRALPHDRSPRVHSHQRPERRHPILARHFIWLTPTAVVIIGGKFDPANLRFPLKLVLALKKIPASDIRDWPAIRAWTSDLAVTLEPALS